MGFRFRKAINFGVFRINLSKRGIGFSTGVKGLRFTKGADGKITRTISMPGTGLSHSEQLNSTTKKGNAQISNTQNVNLENFIDAIIVIGSMVVSFFIIYYSIYYYLTVWAGKY